MAGTPRPPLRQDVTPVLKQLKVILFSNENFEKYLISSDFKNLLEYTNTDGLWQHAENMTGLGGVILSSGYTGKAERAFVPFLKLIHEPFNEKFFCDFIGYIVEDFESYGGKIENIEEINKKMAELNCGSLATKSNSYKGVRTIINIYKSLRRILKRIFYTIFHVIIFLIVLIISFSFFAQRGVSPDIAIIVSLPISALCLFLLHIIDERVLRSILSSK